MPTEMKNRLCGISVAAGQPADDWKPSNYTSKQLQDCNDLTRLSSVPGFLDYETYVRYLALIGHIKTSQDIRVVGLQPPQKLILPVLEETYGPVQGNPDVADGATSWRADQSLWTEESLPEILYAFDRPQRWLAPKDLREPPLKSYQVNGFQLRDIPILPDCISPDLEGWRHVAWTRMDPRICSKDILDRIGSQQTSKSRGRKQPHGQNSTIQMRTARFREDFPALGWVKKGANFEKDRRKLKDRLEAAGIDPSMNTTRGVSWGLSKTAKGESGGRIPVPETKSWPSSVRQQPKVLPVLPSSLPVEQPMSITNHVLYSLPQIAVTQPDTCYSQPNYPIATPEHHKMSISGFFRDLFPLDAGFSSMEELIDTPRKRRKKTKILEDNKGLVPISELLSEVPQKSVQFSKNDPYQLAYIRSVEVQNRFGIRPDEKRHHRGIPDDVLTSSLPAHPATNSVAIQIISEDSLSSKLHRLTTAHAVTKGTTKTHLPQAESVTKESADAIIVEHGNITLTLKTYQQRLSPGRDDCKLLTTFHPAGSEERNRQLEYLLDPVLAPYGFQDCNGYEAPVTGVDSSHDLDCNIWYEVTREEASGDVKASAEQMPTVQENTHLISPGVIMYVDGSMKLFDDLRRVPFGQGEVGRARRVINTMTTSNKGYLNAIGGISI